MSKTAIRGARALLTATAAMLATSCATTMTDTASMTGDMREGPGGEAGPIALRDQGFFWVGTRTQEVENGTAINGQMYVGYQLVAEPKHPYPLLLVHGGGGQATDWMGTPDGRDGFLDYFLAAGFDVYFVDRPGHGRSPNSPFYGELGPAPTTQFISNLFTAQSEQYPGTGLPDDPMVIQHTASSEPGPTVSNAILQEDLAEAIDRIGPVIMVTHSAGGPSGWLALEARPEQVQGILAIETFANMTTELAPLMTFDPPLAEGEAVALEERPSEGENRNPCMLQPEGSVRTLPAFEGKPIMSIVSPNSFPLFTPNVHCSVHSLEQLGADAQLIRLEEIGIEGNGHFMNEELNIGELSAVFIDWLETVE